MDTTKIFWPEHISLEKNKKSGYLVGWNIRSFNVCIATVVDNMNLLELEEFLKTIKTTHPYMDNLCHVSPVVLGVWYVESDKDSPLLTSDENEKEIYARKSGEHLWMTIECQSNSLPILGPVYCGRSKYIIPSSQVIVYRQPKEISPLSFRPLVLDLSTEENQLNQSQTLMNSNIQKHAILTSSKTKEYSVNEMDYVLNQINLSYQLENLISQRPVTPLNDKKKTFSLSFKLLVFYLYLFQLVAEKIFLFLSIKFPFWRSKTLKDISSTALQVHLRLKQACSWPSQYAEARKTQKTNLKRAIALNINFNNSIWLVLNDIIIGIALGYFLWNNIPWIMSIFETRVHDYFIQHVLDMIDWLMGWPSGIKLNDNLDQFLGTMFLLFTAWWDLFLALVRLFLPSILKIICLSGFFGATFIVAMILDLTTLFLFHIWCFYMISASTFNWQLGVLTSLFHLFRGKKKNVLRHRIDSCEYDVEQLLLGTVLFTLLFFLLPTTLAYYLLFSGFRLLVILLMGFLQTILALLNHFPLFALILQFFSPGRLPGGLKIEELNITSFPEPKESWFTRLRKQMKTIFPKKKSSANPIVLPPKNFQMYPKSSFRKGHSRAISLGNWQNSQHQVAYLFIQPLKIPISHIFFQYLLLGRRLVAHFRIGYILKCLMLGLVIPPVKKLQYPLIHKYPPLTKYEDFLQRLDL